MRVLVGCERSGIVREAFRKLGHEAFSCDLEPAEDGSEFHYQEDIVQHIIRMGVGYYDLIILHPECTAVTVAGNHVYAKGKPKYQERLSQIAWIEKLWIHAKMYSPRVVLENPVGVLNTNSILGKAKRQYIQPNEFGHDASKKTGLWLHGVPYLKPTKKIAGRMVEWNGKKVERWSNQTDSGQNKLGPSPTRSMDRARTYTGIAEAVAEQYGNIEDKPERLGPEVRTLFKMA